jgi:general secretion pathway protein B
MSFILDALRKSESERRRSTAPMLAGVPVEVSRPAVPGWMWAVIGALAVAVLVLGGAWWNSTRSGAPPGTSSPAAEVPARQPSGDRLPVTNAVATAVEPATDTRPPSARPAVSSPAPPVTAGPAVTPQAAAEPAAPLRADDSRDRPAIAPAPAAASRRESLPTVDEARAGGVNLPLLSLELHVYHADPASRWVYINGARYTEGRQIAAGPALVEIVPEGVVIGQGGSEYLLLAQ